MTSWKYVKRIFSKSQGGMENAFEEIPKESSRVDVLRNYEKLRNVGKGAFGVAVLYRRLSDDTLVVIKEINIMELKAAERQLALNEVQMLRILDHPNIISYYSSFERDGMLLIEMEYADGGTLSQFLSHQIQPLLEVDILFMFQQIVSAIKYMHNINIVHRDLKTANVFLTKEKVMKIGDFGISKMITTLAQAQSVLGTPYYISPEMCEGKEYNQKSDIWSLGCILYEMTCLRKTFDGANLPALVNKIMKGQFQPVPHEYSASLRELIYDLLQKDPQARPSAAEILDFRIQMISNDQKKTENRDQKLEQDPALALQSSINKSVKMGRSVLYELECFDSMTSLIPVPLPPQFKIKEVAVSRTHFMALTTELMVYSWGEGQKGQLGHGNTSTWSGTPRLVETLKNKYISMIAAGDSFSVFVSESGMLMTCGDGSFGCLGHGDWNDLSRPKLIEKLLSVDIRTISSGEQHVTALSSEGVIYSWGRGQGGRLGLGHEEDSCSPATVPVPNHMVLRNVRCGRDATMAITSDGTLFACGSNKFNKLGLSSPRYIFSVNSQEIEKSLTLRKVNSINGKVSDVSLGPNHTLVLTEEGRVIALGRNEEGQLGRNNTKASAETSAVEEISDKIVTMVVSGTTFSIAATTENEIYFWGTVCQKNSISDSPKRRCSSSMSTSAETLRDSIVNEKQKELILGPKEILALYASPQQIEKGETVGLAGIYVAQNRIFVLVDTTVPLMRTGNSSKMMEDINESQNTDESDSMGPIPDWIKNEIAESKKT